MCFCIFSWFRLDLQVLYFLKVLWFVLILLFLRIYRPNRAQLLLVHGQVTIIFVVSVCLFVCLSVCLFVCAEFFSAVFDPISIKLGHMLYVWV